MLMKHVLLSASSMECTRLISHFVKKQIVRLKQHLCYAVMVSVKTDTICNLFPRVSWQGNHLMLIVKTSLNHACNLGAYGTTH